MRSTAHLCILLMATGLFISGCHDNEAASAADEKMDKHFKGSPTVASDLSFVKRRIDFGTVKSDTTLSARFDFVNTGTWDLVVDNVLPDCSCTSYTLSKKVIKPSDSAYIVLNMSTKNKVGKVKVYSTVSTNTPTKLYSIEIVADVAQNN